MLAQHVVNVVLLGALYGMIGIGFSLVYGVMNTINVAHGSFIMLGAYLTFWLFLLMGIDPFISLPFSALIFFGFGYLLQKYVLNLVARAFIFMVFILTWGLDMLIINSALLMWSGSPRTITTAYAYAGLELGSVVVPYSRLGILFATAVIIGVLFFFMSSTKMGKAIQATALDKEAAQLMGINIATAYSMTLGIAAALAATAGSLMGSIWAISPMMGGPLLSKAFVVVVLGGLGSTTGALIGGLVLAAAEILGASVLGSQWQSAIGFAILIAVLLLKPEGLMGKKFFAEVKVT